MDRSTIWKEVVGAVLKTLTVAPDPAAREVGKVWQWAFERLERQPEQFNQLQGSRPEHLDELVREFLQIAEARARGQSVSDLSFVNKAVQHSLPLEDAPSLYHTSKEVADALAAFGMFIGHHGHNAIDSGGRFPYTCALFGLRKDVLQDILQSKQLPEEQRKIVMKVAKHVPAGDGAKTYFRRLEAATSVERLFGFSRKLIASTDVYALGREFYRLSSQRGPRITLTVSNTSGLWNPHERLGTAEFVRRFGKKPGATLPYKDGYRATNFTDGILNPDHACTRIYVYNSRDTWYAFERARQAAQNTDAFDEYTRQLMAEVAKRSTAYPGTLHLISVEDFDACRPLTLVTRASKDVLMFSNRGSDFSIAHAFWCHLRHSQARNIAGDGARILAIVGDLVSAGLLSSLKALFPLLEAIIGRSAIGTKAREFYAGEIVRGSLRGSVESFQEMLSEKLGLESVYVTAPILSKELRARIGG
jgi:hypothetical protein